MSHGLTMTESSGRIFIPRMAKSPTGDKYNLVIIGGGPAGLITAMNAVKSGAKVALMERDLLGGVCFNYGCIPSKSMIRPARLYAEMRTRRTSARKCRPISAWTSHP